MNRDARQLAHGSGVATQVIEDADAPQATLVCGDQSRALGAGSTTLGRAGDASMQLPSALASRYHARVHWTGGSYVLEDLGSKNGTRLNGRLIHRATPLASGDIITIGDATVSFVSGITTRRDATRPIELEDTRIEVGEKPLSIGRDAMNDVALDDPNVSRLHARLRRGPAGVLVHDLRSSNGTFVDGRPIVGEVALQPGQTLQIGRFRIVYDGAGVTTEAVTRVRLEASGVGVRAGRKRILHPTTVALEPGELVAIIGESGAGKTTLMKALAGVAPPTEGTVTIGGEDVRLHLRSIGYVPQHESVHGKLTLREALRYAALLRLPDDTTANEVAQRVSEVLEELHLTKHADTMVERLSGGQRRRAGVGIELLSQPGLLFLDEPTTGLDPGLELKLMRLLRELADGERSVVLVTHATQSLGLCDRVIVMARGGRLAFDGSPEDALAFFGASSFEDLYRALDERPSEAGEGEIPRSPAGRRPARPAGQRSLGRQLRILAARALRVLVRDRRNLALLLGQVPVIALALMALFGTDVFSGRRGTEPSDAVQLLFLMLTTVIWLGAIDAAREIVKERSIQVREAALGVRPGAYLGAKLLVIGGLLATQVGLLAALVLWTRPLYQAPADYAACVAVLVGAGLVSVAMGLLVSALARSQDQATSFVPLVLIPQLFFAGAIIVPSDLNGPAGVISRLVFARWAYAGLGSAVDMGDRLIVQPVVARNYDSFFDGSPLIALGVLVAFLAAISGVTLLLLGRRSQ